MIPLPAIYALVIAWFVILARVVSKARAIEYDYGVLPDLLRDRREAALRGSAFLRAIEPLVAFFARLVPRLGMDTHRARTRRMLTHAGNPDGHTAETFIGTCMAYALLVYTAILVFFLLKDGAVKPLHGILPALGAYFFPHIMLKEKAERRRVLIDRQTPYFLDLISLTLGAGSTFLEACRSITSGTVRGPLIEELEIMVAEVKAGTRFPDALANMTKRSDSEELALMVQAVRQGDELGTPLVDVFEAQAATNRYRRTKRGEQLAAKLPNRLALPTTFLMLSVLILLFGPIIVRAVRGELM